MNKNLIVSVALSVWTFGLFASSSDDSAPNFPMFGSPDFFKLRSLDFADLPGAGLGTSPSDSFRFSCEQNFACIKRGIFTIERPEAPGYAWLVNRWEERPSREGGWIAVLAAGGQIKHDVCKKLAVSLPIMMEDEASQETVSDCITELNVTYATKMFNPIGAVQQDNRYDVKKVAILMRWGNGIIRAFGEQAADQSNFVPDVIVRSEEFIGEDHPYKLSMPDDLSSPRITVGMPAITEEVAAFSRARGRPLQRAYDDYAGTRAQGLSNIE